MENAKGVAPKGMHGAEGGGRDISRGMAFVRDALLAAIEERVKGNVMDR